MIAHDVGENCHGETRPPYPTLYGQPWALIQISEKIVHVECHLNNYPSTGQAHQELELVFKTGEL